MKLPQIPQDKANHFVYGSIICFLASLLFTPLVSLCITIIIGILKEVYDKISKKGNPEILDVIATTIGALPIFIINILK
jgi:hypothetical protein